MNLYVFNCFKAVFICLYLTLYFYALFTQEGPVEDKGFPKQVLYVCIKIYMYDFYPL